MLFGNKPPDFQAEQFFYSAVCVGSQLQIIVNKKNAKTSFDQITKLGTKPTKQMILTKVIHSAVCTIHSFCFSSSSQNILISLSSWSPWKQEMNIYKEKWEQLYQNTKVLFWNLNSFQLTIHLKQGCCTLYFYFEVVPLVLVSKTF